MVFELDDERWGFLVGDAAFQTHFWPGRGLNSAFKEVAMLAWCLTAKFALNNRLKRNEIIHLDYFQAFMQSLRKREHRFRSLIFLCGNSMIEHVDNACVCERERHEQTGTLLKRIIEARNVFIRRQNGGNDDLIVGEYNDLPELDSFKRVDLKRLLAKMNIFNLNVMVNTGAWPAAPGEEILPRDFIGPNEFGLPEINEKYFILVSVFIFLNFAPFTRLHCFMGVLK